MINLSKLFDKIFEKIPGYLFGLLSFLIGILGISLALILSPGYKMWRYSISQLTHEAGGIFMSLGLVFSNILAVLFIVYLGRTIKDDQVNELIRKIAVGSGILATISGILIGIFSGDLSVRYSLISDFHGFFALISWFSGAIVCGLFSFLMVRNLKFTKNISSFGYLVSGIVIFYLIPFVITNLCFVFQDVCFSFGTFLTHYINASLEWLVIFSTSTWYLANSIYIKHKNL
ncbi:MAG: hypothetical protein ACW96S_00375 [Promethearchaeota archaeon]|jgi:hypothetical protein